MPIPWTQQPVTVRQLQRMQALGIACPWGLLRGEAAVLIARRLAARKGRR